MSLSEYEQSQLDKINEWKNQQPGEFSKAYGKVSAPVGWVVSKVMPDKAIKKALDYANTAAEWLTDTSDVRKKAEVDHIEQLQYKSLELSDKMSGEGGNWAIGLATAEGAVAGTGGAVTMAVDIPALITLSLRTIHKVAVCYGYDIRNELDRQLTLAVLSVASANSVEERQAALDAIKAIEVMIDHGQEESFRKGLVGDSVAKTLGIISLKALTKQLAINITHRKSLQVIPVLGAVVGGSVNAWYLKEVSSAAKRVFQERWLIDNHKQLLPAA